MRVVDLACLAAAIAGAAYVYTAKHGAEVANDTRRALERDIAELSSDVSLLEADLAALEQPARLQAVIASLPEAFGLEPITSAHYVRLSDIPFRSELIALDAASGADAITDTESADDPLAGVLPSIEAPGLIDLLLQQLAGPDQPVAVSQSTPIAVPFAIDGIGALIDGVEQGRTP